MKLPVAVAESGGDAEVLGSRVVALDGIIPPPVRPRIPESRPWQ